MTPTLYTGWTYSNNMDNTKGSVTVYTYGKLVFVNLYDCYMKNSINLSSGWTVNISLIENLPKCLCANLSVGQIVYDNYKYTQELYVKVYNSAVGLQLRGVEGDYGPTPPSTLPVRRFNAGIVYISK